MTMKIGYCCPLQEWGQTKCVNQSDDGAITWRKCICQRVDSAASVRKRNWPRGFHPSDRYTRTLDSITLTSPPVSRFRPLSYTLNLGLCQPFITLGRQMLTQPFGVSHTKNIVFLFLMLKFKSRLTA